MATYLLFLRAINLGARRKVPMAELRRWLAEEGFGDVETHIQTGNVRVTTRLRSRARVEAEAERVLRARTGFEVVTIAFTPAELAGVYAEAERLFEDRARRYLSLLKEEPDPETAAEVDGWEAPGEGAKVVGRAICWWVDHPTQHARMSNARVERQLGPSTTRDLKVVRAVVERWGP